jgi:Tol biopolymer transport system component
MLLTLLLAAATQAAAPPAARFDAVQMMKLDRLADPQLSPDGKWVAYQSTDIDIDAGTRNTDIWIVAADGQGAPRRLTDDPAADTRPRWSPDGRSLAFDSARGGESLCKGHRPARDVGRRDVWIHDWATAGGRGVRRA